MAPPSLPQPLNRLPDDELRELSGRPPAQPALRPLTTERPGSPQEAVRSPQPPGGGHPGRLPGPEGLDRPASAARLPHRSHAFDLPATPVSVGRTRRQVGVLLSTWGIAADTRDNAVLVASELLTNALTHSGGERIVCRVHGDARRLRIEVEDEHRGPTPPAPRRPGPDDQSGRGLLLVDALCTDWGVEDAPDRPGRTVWAELATTP